jgi:predicted peptidase
LTTLIDIDSNRLFSQDESYVSYLPVRYLLTPILIVASLLPVRSFSQAVPGQHPEEFQGKFTRQVQMKYLLFIPEGYKVNERKYWPLIMYLHGGSRRGIDIEKLREPGSGITALVEKNKSFPFIVLSPQCPDGEYWTDTEALIALLDEVTKKYLVDPRRVYLTGHSMGGFGTWYLAYKHPERFAAIAPVSPPFVITAWAPRLKKMPIWTFHGAKEIAPISGTEDLIKALKNLGNNVRFTLFPDRDHFILDVYDNQDLYSWFLQHRLRSSSTRIDSQ